MGEAKLAYGQRVNVLPVFDLTLRYNHGAAFSFLSNQPGWQQYFFITVAVTVSVVIVYVLRGEMGERWTSGVALTLIMSGGIGNCIDRVLYGHVIDFLLFYWNHLAWP